MKDTRQCDCCRPWPKMVRLGFRGPDRYFLCSRCGCIRWETAAGPGLVGDIAFCDVNDPWVPRAVWAEAQHILDQPSYTQLALFARD